MKRFVSAAILMIALMTGMAMPAYAEAPPNNISTNVVDNSESIDKSRVDELVKQVQRETGYQLYVYFTNDFSGTSGAQWAYQAATNSHLDDSKAVLFAVAVKDRKYGSAFPSNSVVSQKGSTMEQAAIPAMKQGEWTDAVEAYANQLIAVVHKTDAESAQNAGHTDAAGGVFLTVITWIVAILVSLGLIVLGVKFGPRATRSLLDYIQSEKSNKRAIRELKESVPAAITELDESIVAAKANLSYAIGMYGDALLDRVAARVDSAQGDMQTAIKKLATVSATSYGFNGSRYQLRDLKEIAVVVHRGEQNVSEANRSITALETRAAGIRSSIAQTTETVKSLLATVAENEKTMARVREQFDESYLVELIFALDAAKKSIQKAKQEVSEASPAFAGNLIVQAEELANSAASHVVDAKQHLAVFDGTAEDMSRFPIKRDNIVRKFENEISANSDAHSHPSVMELVPAAKDALAEAAARDFRSGNPDKDLAKVLEPAYAYRSAVARLEKIRETVKDGKAKLHTRISAMKNWQQHLSTVAEHGVQVTEREKAEIAEVDRIMDTEVATVANAIDAVSRYDLEAVVALSGKLDELNSRIKSLCATVVRKIEAAIEAEEQRQREIRAEEERKRKEKKRKQEEEAARRRRRNSSSSSSSSSYYGAGYGAGYSSGFSSGGSDFSSSGGSFGGGFDSSGGSF